MHQIINWYGVVCAGPDPHPMFLPMVPAMPDLVIARIIQTMNFCLCLSLVGLSTRWLGQIIVAPADLIAAFLDGSLKGLSNVKREFKTCGWNGIFMQLNRGATGTATSAALAAPAAAGPWGAPTRPTTPTCPQWLAANTGPCGAPHPQWLAATSGPSGAPKRTPPYCHAPSPWLRPTPWLLAATSYLPRPATPPFLKFNSSGLSKLSLPIISTGSMSNSLSTRHLCCGHLPPSPTSLSSSSESCSSKSSSSLTAWLF